MKTLEDTEGNILLTTGSKELYKYCVSERIKHRLYVRVLPSVESLSLCTEQGICGKQVIAMQGPFTAEMNEAIIRQYEIAYLVTKESGVPGGYQEKINAAKRTGVRIFVIGCSDEGEGYSFSEICQKLEDMGGKNFQTKNQKKGNMEIPCRYPSMSFNTLCAVGAIDEFHLLSIFYLTAIDNLKLAIAINYPPLIIRIGIFTQCQLKKLIILCPPLSFNCKIFFIIAFEIELVMSDIPVKLNEFD